MTIWDFFNYHWFLAFLTICFTYGIVVRLIRIPLLLIRGWPPAPLDADGDVHHPERNAANEQKRK
ncbi:MAG: hypothetical protein K8U57_21445 [Planctomycetes bacterium]|nr:hypothetical protein [Planctomycetota bacterium]